MKLSCNRSKQTKKRCGLLTHMNGLSGTNEPCVAVLLVLIVAMATGLAGRLDRLAA
jgi:hypothetical protein